MNGVNKIIMKKRDQWSSNFGFLMAAAGSAVGLGNLWKFPYVVGMNGGGIFIIAYVILLVLLGAPILMSEMAIGRNTRLNPIGACNKIKNGWGFVGGLGVLGAFIILCYYSVIGGWVLKYFFKYIISSSIDNPSEYFKNFTESIYEPILWHITFAIICIIIVMKGISGGIEKISKIFLPMLAVFIIIIAINVIKLPNALNGLKFFIIPDLSAVSSFSDIFSILLNAMGQVFFSLSLGMGTLITYGSYLSRSSNIQKNSLYIPVFDLIIALLACTAILPAVFAFNLEPTAGSGLLFNTLPYVFDHMKYGKYLAVIFFLLVFFAAVTSAISLIEVIASYFIDNMKWSRKKACIIPGIGFILLGTAASLSFGIFNNIKLFGHSIFDILTILSDKIIMPMGGLFICILVGYIWKTKNMFYEISSGGLYKVYFKKTLTFLIKFFVPLMIIIIFITSFF